MNKSSIELSLFKTLSLKEKIIKNFFYLQNLKKISQELIMASNPQKQLNMLMDSHPALRKPLKQIELQFERNQITKEQVLIKIEAIVKVLKIK